MGQMIPITRTECSAAELRRLAVQAAAGDQARRLLAVELILDNRSRTEAAEQGGMQQRQTLRDWVHRYNEAGVDGLKSRIAPGPARC
ncbi:helix-turn-helix domain-containing protein [Rhodopila sp.]|jgi:transposase|uniref:helix-turn-helix domain-containing protein n=1 Tax=Rhodopila sp. TaxID=2480087 RepID=UPI002C7A6CFF|nr:helix-turn-helix domain-containing protein [Rhodopila sp.]HVZ10695.1 helix-turn-helix domain-containing protein [Rhodopila sp.]